MFGTIKELAFQGVAFVEQLTGLPAWLPPSIQSRRFVLIGASVSKLWHPEVRYPNVEVATCYSFDKTPIIERLLHDVQRPDGVCIKQCAAYFPLPLEEKKELVLGWLSRLDEAGIRTALATVVPVTESHDRANPGRLEGLLEYNHWMVQICDERSLPLLDLSTALRTSPMDPHLDRRWATRDGLHVRRQAYRERLDPLIESVLLQVFDRGTVISR